MTEFTMHDDYAQEGAYHWRGVYPRVLWRYNLQMAANYQVALESLVTAPGDGHGLKVLDVGCGDGVMLYKLLAQGMTAMGIDVVASAVRLAQGELRKRWEGDIHLTLASAEDLPFLNETWGAVVAVEVIEHLGSAKAFVDEVARVLRPGGVFVVTSPRKGTSGEHSPHHTVEFDEDELQALLSTSFREVVVRGFNAELAEAVYQRGRRPMKLAMKLLGKYMKNPFTLTGHPPLAGRFRSLLAVCHR